MITHVSLATVRVTDQDEARAFYIDKLGFQEATDVSMGDGYRWVTVSHPDHPELELTLMKPGPPLDEDGAAAFRRMLDKGSLGAVGIATDDCHATYKDLAAKGVEFIRSRPTARTAWKPSCATAPATGSCSSNAGPTREPATARRRPRCRDPGVARCRNDRPRRVWRGNPAERLGAVPGKHRPDGTTDELAAARTRVHRSTADDDRLGTIDPGADRAG
jgi:catechol 2,3-dioxygenase-like lactoylglutathione lyase family enzyme